MQLGFWGPPCAVADMEDLDFAIGFADLVIDEKWTVQQLADQVAFANQATHPGKPSEQLDVCDQGTAKARSSLCVIFGDVADDFGEVV